MDLKKQISKALEKYKYAKLNLANSKFNIYEDSVSLMFEDFFYPRFQTFGDCQDLAEHFLQNEPYKTQRALGSEPKYFGGNDEFHYFAILPTIELPSAYWALPTSSRLEFMEYANPLVIDPAFKVVESLEKSDYNLRDLPMFQYQPVKDLVFEKSDMFQSAPLFFSEDVGLVEIAYAFRTPLISRRFSNAKPDFFSTLEGKDLDYLKKKDSDLNKIITNIQKSYEDRVIF